MEENKLKYLTLINWVKEKIENNELQPGEKLYTEHELSKMFNMSRQTVRHAISILEQENYVARRRGSGTYICDVNENKPAKESESTMNVAVITTYVDGYIFPSIIKGIERVISKAGYTVQIAFTNNRIETERQVLENILNKNMVDGLIIEPTKSALPNPNFDLYKEIQRRNIPAIFFHSYYPGLTNPHVCLDDKSAGQMAVEYLIHAGHENIGGIFKSDDGQGHLRYSGYVEGIMKNNLKIRDENIVWIDTHNIKKHHIKDKDILERFTNCTAVVCYNDEVAFQLVDVCLKNNIKIPEDLSIISIDNSDLCMLSEVHLTSIAHPMGDLGKKVAENLIKMIENEEFDGTYEFTPVIVERDSVKNIHKRGVFTNEQI